MAIARIVRGDWYINRSKVVQQHTVGIAAAAAAAAAAAQQRIST